MADKGPQTGGQEPPTTLLRETAIERNGNTIIVSTEDYVEKPDGSIVRRNRQNQHMAPDGRWLSMDEFIANSWTGLMVPKDRLASCLNPFEIHGYRLVYLGLDGIISDLGNVLCQQCVDAQKRRMLWKNVMLFGLLYNPEKF